MKKKIILSTVASVLTIGIVSTAVALNTASVKTGADSSPLTTQLDQQSQELANHEARISNNENNVKDLQTKTNTPSSQDNTIVPSAPVNNQTPSANDSTAPQSTPLSNQVTIASIGYQVKGIETDCIYNYSDGTYYSWLWKTSPHDQPNGVCDDSVIGQPKAN